MSDLEELEKYQKLCGQMIQDQHWIEKDKVILEADRDEWKRRALEAEEAGKAILEWEGANCDGYADKVSDDCPFCKMRTVLNSINSDKNDTV